MTSPKLPIEALLAEERAFEPTAALREQANISDPSVYERAKKDPEGFWAEAARSLDWFKTMGQGSRMEPSDREVVCRRQDQCFL